MLKLKNYSTLQCTFKITGIGVWMTTQMLLMCTLQWGYVWIRYTVVCLKVDVLAIQSVDRKYSAGDMLDK